jgi:1-acyl-sn-glycerol-3-phosphate acyltransferase
MEPWHYHTSEELDKTFVERLRNFPRAPDMLVFVLRSAFAILTRAWLRIYHRYRIVGPENLPREGSYVIVANHASHLDTLAIVSALPLAKLHRVFPAAAKDYFFGSLPRTALASILVNALPFDRQAHVRQAWVSARQCFRTPAISC